MKLTAKTSIPMRRTISLPLFLIALVVVPAVVIYQHNNGSYPSVSSSSKTDQSLAVRSTSPKVNFKEWGVSIKTPQILTGMTYEITQPTPERMLPAPVATSAPANNLLESRYMNRLYLDKYQTLANQCFNQDKSKKQPFASLIKTDGKPLANDHTVLKTFKNYYISNLGPSIDNHAKCTNKNAQNGLLELNNQLQTALKNAFNTAEEGTQK